LHSHEKHRAEASKKLRIGVVTVSTSRFFAQSKQEGVSDDSGDKAVERVKAAGHDVVFKKIVNDDPQMIRDEVQNTVSQQETDVLVFNGGTGLSPRDVTIEAVSPILDKTLDGFGEIFRHVGYRKIGAAAILSRALAGTVKGRIVICLPGSPHAVETGLELILDELPHAVLIANQGRDTSQP